MASHIGNYCFLRCVRLSVVLLFFVCFFFRITHFRYHLQLLPRVVRGRGCLPVLCDFAFQQAPIWRDTGRVTHDGDGASIEEGYEASRSTSC
jgi:hypothetical protein